VHAARRFGGPYKGVMLSFDQAADRLQTEDVTAAIIERTWLCQSRVPAGARRAMRARLRPMSMPKHSNAGRRAKTRYARIRSERLRVSYEISARLHPHAPMGIFSTWPGKIRSGSVIWLGLARTIFRNSLPLP
jgi:hypothetical protein